MRKRRQRKRTDFEFLVERVDAIQTEMVRLRTVVAPILLRLEMEHLREGVAVETVAVPIVPHVVTTAPHMPLTKKKRKK